MRKILIYSFVLASFFLVDLSAQNITATAKIDSTMMWIGNQTRLWFEISQQKNQKVVFPIFSDTIVGGLELVEPVKLDTTQSPDGQLIVSQSYLVTAFEDSLFYIPSYPFVVDGDTVWSKSLSLKVVQPFQIDTASNKIADIKPVLNTKFYWKGLLKNILIGLIIIIVLLIIFFIIRKFVQKKPIFEKMNDEPELPPYQIAITKLEKIKNEKLWQQNRIKEYHTELTDVLREYIERTFEIQSLEMTSEEIIQQLVHLKFESKQAYQALQQILKLADLVKFAKWNPTIDEHELSLNNSFLFVNETKIEEPEIAENEETEKL